MLFPADVTKEQTNPREGPGGTGTSDDHPRRPTGPGDRAGTQRHQLDVDQRRGVPHRRPRRLPGLRTLGGSSQRHHHVSH